MDKLVRVSILISIDA